MIVRVVLLVGMLGMASSALAGPVTPPALERAIEAYEHAQLIGDRAALETLLAPDYLLINSAGAREDKAAFIADLTAPDFKLKPFVVQAPIQRNWTGGAVVAGVARQAGTDGGKAFDACIRYADVWKLSGGRWQVALTHVARMPSPDANGCKAP